MDIRDIESEAQYKIISDLQKKIRTLEDENRSLMLMVEQNVPLIQNQITNIGISNERIICETQVALLKEAAITRELTLEESRKFQIYVDILEKLNAKADDGIKADISEEELLRLVVKNE